MNANRAAEQHEGPDLPKTPHNPELPPFDPVWEEFMKAHFDTRQSQD